jgi:hypothetical protein
MGDEVYSLFIVVVALTTLSMPAIAQPAFAVLGGALGALAVRAATRDEPLRRPTERGTHDVTDV